MLLALLASAAHAATWTAEDLVTAAARGVPSATTTAMAVSVPHDASTTTYLVRRGVASTTLREWGFDVSHEVVADAAGLGPLPAPPPDIPQRPAADARAINLAIQDEAAREPATPDWGAPPRVVHLHRGEAGIVTGALLAVAGGMTLSFGSGMAPDSGTMFGFSTIDSVSINAGTPEPDPVLMAVGAIGILGAGISFHFGAHELTLAGSYPEGWAPEAMP